MSAIRTTTIRLLAHRFEDASKYRHVLNRHPVMWNVCTSHFCVADRDVIAEARAQMERKKVKQ